MQETQNLPENPILKQGSLRIVDRFSANDIIKLYQLQEKLDVTKYFETSNNVLLLECQQTKYRFYYPYETAGDKDFYENLQRRSEQTGLDYDRENAADHEFALNQIQPNSKVLEIGCGSGKFLQSLSEITKDICGLELNSLIAEKAQKKGLDVKVQLIEDYAKEAQGEYDVVCAFQVLEHIPNVNSFISSALDLLKPNGKLIFSVPNNEPFFQRFSKYEVLNMPPHHMGLWNLEVFKNLAEYFNLNLEKYHLTGKSSFKADVYLRAKYWAKVKSLPRQHNFAEKLRILAFAPFALVASSFDLLRGKNGFGHISIVLRKK
jgi:2-polyprenyl-3-methyl-5-hydroxy-6-metoxy-1,4-benzoquinol methylase